MWFRLFLKYHRLFGMAFLCPPDDTPPAPTPEEIAAENAALKAKIAEFEKKAKPPAPDDEEESDDDLLARARASRKTSGDDAEKTRRLESAIGFNMRSADFLKQNAALLPADAEEIFKQANKETFDDASEKAASIKSGLVQSFFDIQANVDLLTAGQKAQLDEFRKLTKNGKLERAQNIFDMVFEPAFERLKDMKKAEALNRGGHATGSVQDELKKKIQAQGQKRFKIPQLGEEK